jgi:hypothetical protein
MKQRIMELIQPSTPDSYGNMPPDRLKHVLEYVLKWSYLPDDITHDEQVALLYELVNPIELENGEEAHRLTEDGEKLLSYFMFGPWTTQI